MPGSHSSTSTSTSPLPSATTTSGAYSKHSFCTGSCEPGSQCHPNECIFGGEKPLGVGILELGVYEQGEGNGKFSLQVIGDHGGRILSQLGGFPSK
jgi:hypothetical protein